ncbi:MAG: peptidoglycan bridge formation glycyltransferase FemA/FemB family protein [Candidatus Pacebacteria bacterium]|nr:peptidoglycan bridge formation glycyltransferase FemA/FemB family protein [Candidatus Paceibacterota bacterium]MDD4830756.1 peptidoglycan bridge formation glycyltransferase FemA/FemB family protein [Candidatus Paceibacterota bacterium]MDD4874854.1 peptidoglycan bridge formation glycyltransferase FemA/FemB family protein [Candidatus Paceibacterota bacterium]
MEIKEITDKSQWENFLAGCEEKTFLQSFNWGEFNKSLGDKICRLGIFENNKMVAAAQTIKISARRGKFLFLPHGPTIIQNAKIKNQNDNSCLPDRQVKSKILEILVKELKNIAKKEGCSFIRIAPIWQKNAENEKFFDGLGFRDAPIHMHPEFTWELNLKKTEEDLLAQMRKTTRYLIRQAEKDNDIEISQSKEIKDLEKFEPIFRKTAKRQSFVPFSSAYLRKEMESFLADDKILFFFGKYKGEIVSAAMIIFWSGKAFYHQSGSSHSKAPVSYLLQWEAIKEAKRRGCGSYNFWGIAPFKKITGRNGSIKTAIRDKNHPWYGLSLFKIGFGGETKEYVKTKDLPLSVFYWPTFIFEVLRKKKRNL